MHGAGESALLAVIEEFQAAALGEGSWMTALDRFATATGSRTGQIIGLGSQSAVPFNMMTEMPPESADDFFELGGGDPTVNRRVALGSAISEGRILTDGDFPALGRPDDPPELRAWIERYDVPHICLTPLVKRGGLLVGLAVLRTAREGHIETDQKGVFSRLAPHLSAAVRTQMTLADQGAVVLTGALEALSVAAFVCDDRGAVLGRSARTEPLLEAGTHLRLRGGRLGGCNPADDEALAARIAEAARGDLSSAAGPVLLRDAGGRDPVLVDVAGLPAGRHPFYPRRAVLVMLRQPRPNRHSVAEVAAALYGLTRAEAEVAADLVQGLSPRTIAERRGSAVTTVRTHVRSLFEKAAVSSQIELVAAINRQL